MGGVVGVALGLAGWAGVMMGQLAGYVWSQVVATGAVPSPTVKEDRLEDRLKATTAAVE